MQGTYNYVPGETNVSRLYNFAAVVYQQFVHQPIIYYYYHYYPIITFHFSKLAQKWTKINQVVLLL